MSFPRPPIGSAANSSLGAVGGPRGTAAGALRILVEFLTTYDSNAVKQLQADLTELSAAEQAAANKELASARALQTAQERQAKVRKEIEQTIARAVAPGQAGKVNRELKDIQAAGVLNKLGRQRLQTLDDELGLKGALVDMVTREAHLTRGLVGFNAKLTKDAATRVGIREQELAVSQQISRFEAIKAAVPQKLAGLALGALGGIVGGALIGIGFTAIQAVIDRVGESFLDLVDPARHAREEVQELADAVNTLAAAEDYAGDRGKALVAVLADLGIKADERTQQLISQAIAAQDVIKYLDEEKTAKEIAAHADSLVAEAKRKLRDEIIAEEREQGKLQGTNEQGIRTRGSIVDTTIYAAEVERRYAEIVADSTTRLGAAAQAARELEFARRQQAGATSLAAFAEQQLASVLASNASSFSSGINSRIEALQEGAGPSARTRQLEAQLEALQGGGGSSNKQELANIAEERALILLRMKLRLQGANIDLEKYSGKFLLEAIRAKQKALQKEADEQDRLNKLLDLQFRMSQRLRRNEGESISDFLERRAKENRDQLSEQRDLEREAVEARLEELEAKTADEVALAELAEREKNAAATSGKNARIKALQEELKASQKADAKALQSKIDALRRQEKAYLELVGKVEKYSQESTNVQIKEAIRAATTVGDLAKASGEIQGVAAALSFLQALERSGTLTPVELARVREAIARMSSTISSYESRLLNLGRNTTKRTHFAEGGIIPLTNSSSPFGSNVRFGEQGTEMAVILQNKVAQGVKDSMRRGGGDTFVVNKSTDWLADRYQLKKVVKEAIAEAVR